MRIVLLLSLILAPVQLFAQTPAAPTGTPQPRATRPATSRTALVVTVTDPSGATLPGIHVEVLGTSDRSGDTNESGSLRFANVRAGTHRVRFSGPNVITFEREVFVRAGQTADLDVTLNPASSEDQQPQPQQPPQAAPQAPPTTGGPPVGPPGEPKLVSILDLLEKDFIGRQPRKETFLGCSGNARSTMIQLNETQPERLYETGEAMYYVLGGEGTMRLNGRESALVTGNFALVPRGASHGFVRKGKRPLILLAVLSGEPCQPAP
jgi:hypothetical protein